MIQTNTIVVNAQTIMHHFSSKLNETPNMSILNRYYFSEYANIFLVRMGGALFAVHLYAYQFSPIFIYCHFLAVFLFAFPFFTFFPLS